MLEWESAQRWPLALLLPALLVPVAVWAYHQSHRPIRYRSLLLGLRVVVILLLSLLWMEPALRLPVPPGNGLAFVIDTSRSMSVIDTQRSTSDLIHILGLQAEAAIDPAIAAALSPVWREMRLRSELLAALDVVQLDREGVAAARGDGKVVPSSRQPTAATRPRGRSPTERLASDIGHTRQLLAASPWATDTAVTRPIGAWLDLPSDAVDAPMPQLPMPTSQQALGADVVQRLSAVGSLSRRQIIESLLTKTSGSVLTRLLGALPAGTRLTAAAGGSTLSDVGDIATGAGPGASDGWRLQSAAAENQTDLGALLTQAGRRLADWGAGAVVLVSDGKTRDPAGALQAARRLGVPVICVSAAAAGQTSDLAVQLDPIPARGAAGETVTVSGHVNWVGPEQSAEVRLQFPGQTQVQPVVHNENEPALFSFPLRLTAPGLLEGTVSVRLTGPRDAGGKEATLENNQATVMVRVVASPAVIAVLTSGALRDVLNLRQLASTTGGYRLITVDEVASAVAASDAVVVAHPNASLPDSAWSSLSTAVAERGIPLIILAGPDTAGIAAPHAESLMPWKMRAATLPTWHTDPGDDPGMSPVSVDGSLRFSPDQGVFRVLDIGKLADPWRLVATADSGRFTLPLVVERDLGHGRIIVALTDQFWRFGSWSGAIAKALSPSATTASEQALWGQLIRRAGVSQPAVVAESWQLDVSPEPAIVGSPVTLTAAWTGKGSPPRGLRASISQADHADHADHAEQPIALTARDELHWSAEIRPKVAGTWAVRLSDPIAPTLFIEVLPEPLAAAELQDVQADPSLLQAIAAATGGRFIPLEQIDRLPDLAPAVLESAAPLPAHSRRVRLWDSPLMLVMIAALLCTEWATRKEVGLP